MEKPFYSIILLGTLGALLVFSVEIVPKYSEAAAAGGVYSGYPTFNSFMHANAPSLTIKKAASGLKMVTNPTSTVVIVNKFRNLSPNYVPSDLVVPDVAFSFSGDSSKKQMRKIAADALEKLFAGAKEDGVTLKAVSGFRSYWRQKAIFDDNAKRKGEEAANKTSARPGQSEHQTGLVMDVSSASVGYGLETGFGKTKEGKWLKAHAAEYGFIIRYEEDTEELTGYSYEPWHIRYVGVYIAKQVTAADLTLEQYMKKF